MDPLPLSTDVNALKIDLVETIKQRYETITGKSPFRYHNTLYKSTNIDGIY